MASPDAVLPPIMVVDSDDFACAYPNLDNKWS